MTEQNNLNLSAVVVNYNGDRFLDKNLTSLTQQRVPLKQIVVVDNDSDDRSLEILKTHQKVETIESKDNLGYAGGANLGISRCDGELILVANTDTHFHHLFSEKVIKIFRQDPEISILSPLLLRFNGQHIDSAGQTHSLALYPKEIGYGRPTIHFQPVEGPVFSACGAATVFRRSALEALKLHDEYYDEDFFAFWEDFDIGWRAQNLGMKVYFDPEAIVYHFRSGTMPQKGSRRLFLALNRPAAIKYHLVLNRYLTLIKNFRLRRFWWSIPFILVKDLIWVGMLTLSAPKIIIKLIKSSKYIRRAYRKRRMIKDHE